ncbi:MAG: hypothetical protein H7Y32_17980 [Chloroflexales bacterium]|nr:hypothetical protein [Chloroflexales bacterium]
MTPTQIFGLQIAVNLVVYGLAARWYLAPRLASLPLDAALTPLLLFHALRTIGVTFVVPGVVGEPLPAAFAIPGAYGDLLAVGLAMLSVLALRVRWRGALALIWIFTVVGLLDFVNAFAQGLRLDIAARYALGPVWFIPTFAVPAFTVAHLVILALLVTRGHEYGTAREVSLHKQGV